MGGEIMALMAWPYRSDHREKTGFRSYPQEKKRPNSDLRKEKIF